MCRLPNEYGVVHAVKTDKNVIIVGEHHSSDASAGLVQDIIHEYEPNTVAIESGPTRWSLLNNAPSKGGRKAVSYARRNKRSLVLLDSEQDATISKLVSATQTEDDEQEREPPLPNSDGDIPEKELEEYRKHVATEQPERFRIIWAEREEKMAQRVRGMVADHTLDDPILCVVGASHAKQIAKLASTISEQELPDSRIIEF